MSYKDKLDKRQRMRPMPKWAPLCIFEGKPLNVLKKDVRLFKAALFDMSVFRDLLHRCPHYFGGADQMRCVKQFFAS